MQKPTNVVFRLLFAGHMVLWMSTLSAACFPPALELRTGDVHVIVHTTYDQRVPEVLREKLLSLRQCYDSAAAGQSRSSGSLELVVHFDRQGKVKTFSSQSKLPAPVKRCFADHIARWRIPPQTTDLRFGPYAIRFEPRQGTPLTRPGKPVGEVRPTPPRATRPVRRIRPRARRILKVVRLRGKLSSYVPPVPTTQPAANTARAKIRARVYGLRRCYNRALINNRCLSGWVKLSFTILRSGKLGDVTVISNLPGAMAQCLRSKLQRWNLNPLPTPVAYGPFQVRFTSGQNCP